MPMDYAQGPAMNWTLDDGYPASCPCHVTDGSEESHMSLTTLPYACRKAQQLQHWEFLKAPQMD